MIMDPDYEKIEDEAKASFANLGYTTEQIEKAVPLHRGIIERIVDVPIGTTVGDISYLRGYRDGLRVATRESESRAIATLLSHAYTCNALSDTPSILLAMVTQECTSFYALEDVAERIVIGYERPVPPSPSIYSVVECVDIEEIDEVERISDTPLLGF